MRAFAGLLSVLAVVVMGLTAAPANAHAVLVASSPVDGTRVESAPATVTLTFDESVTLIPTATQVISTSGERADAGTPHLSADGATVVIPLRADLPTGSYAAIWRVVSADTHVVSGSITFGIGQDAGAAPPVPAGPSRSLTLAGDVARGVLYLGMVLCVGTALVCRMLWPWAGALRRVRVPIVGGWALLVGATVGQFLVLGPQSLNLGWREAFSVAAVSDTLHGRPGEVLVVRAAVLAVLGVALMGARRGSATALVLASIGLAATVVVDGHAGVGTWAWLAVAATSVHVLAMAIWLGGLLVLAVAVLPSGHVANLRRWSLVALTCVSTLVVTGTYQAWRQVAPLAALWSTDYGITLIVKVTVVTATLAIAYVARRRLLPKVLRRTVPVEMALGLVVLLVTTALVSEAPARTTYGPPVALSAPLDQRTASVVVDTTRRGPAEITVTPLAATGLPIPAASVSGTLSSEDAGIAALAVRFQRAADGRWHSAHAVVPLPGAWTLKLVVEFSTSDAVATATHYRVW